MRRLLERLEGTRHSKGEEDRFIKSVHRAATMISYGQSKEEAMQSLIDDGVDSDISYFAVVAASIMIKAGLK